MSRMAEGDVPEWLDPKCSRMEALFSKLRKDIVSALRSDALPIYRDQCQANRGSGFTPLVVTGQCIQHETQTERLCVAAKGLGEDPVSMCFNLHDYFNICAIQQWAEAKKLSYCLIASRML